MLEEGQKAPDFELETHEGIVVCLSNLLHRDYAVLYFFPKADTPG